MVMVTLTHVDPGTDWVEIRIQASIFNELTDSLVAKSWLTSSAESPI